MCWYRPQRRLAGHTLYIVSENLSMYNIWQCCWLCVVGWGGNELQRKQGINKGVKGGNAERAYVLLQSATAKIGGSNSFIVVFVARIGCQHHRLTGVVVCHGAQLHGRRRHQRRGRAVVHPRDRRQHLAVDAGRLRLRPASSGQ